jgi:SAM-dependent MidA family methyltransferase
VVYLDGNSLGVMPAAAPARIAAAVREEWGTQLIRAWNASGWFDLPQRLGGTLMCHRAHRADADPLVDVGLKDITVHVDFSAIALAAQAAGLDVAGYTSQARFLINCGIVPMLQQADARARVDALKLLNEHEMGELFKVIALSRGIDLDLVGFCQGDRTHRL